MLNVTPGLSPRGRGKPWNSLARTGVGSGRRAFRLSHQSVALFSTSAEEMRGLREITSRLDPVLKHDMLGMGDLQHKKSQVLPQKVTDATIRISKSEDSDTGGTKVGGGRKGAIKNQRTSWGLILGARSYYGNSLEEVSSVLCSCHCGKGDGLEGDTACYSRIIEEP